MGELQSLPAALTWSLSGSEGGGSSFYTANYLQKKEVPQAWDTSTRKLGGKSPWVIASVPEPAGLVLLGTGACSGPHCCTSGPAAVAARRSSLRRGVITASPSPRRAGGEGARKG